MMNKWLLGAFAVALLLAVSNLLMVTISILLLIFAGILFGVFLNGISHWVSDRTRLPYLGAYAIWVVVLIAAVAAGTFYMGSSIAKQTGQLSGELQSATDELLKQISRYEWMPDVEDLSKNVAENGKLLPQLARGLQSALWGLTGAIVIVFVGLYVAYDPTLYETGLIKLVPRDRRTRAAELLAKVRSALRRWIVARLISMTIVGVLTAIGLSLLGVPLAMTLGVLAAMLTFIPNVGPILAAIPQVLLAFQVDTQTVWFVILLNLALQGVESYLVTPMIERYEVTLPPALTISMQLLLGATVGAIGLMMAAPLTATMMVLVQMLYIRDQLKDPSPGELASD